MPSVVNIVCHFHAVILQKRRIYDLTYDIYCQNHLEIA